jgi:hypothetical protein
MQSSYLTPSAPHSSLRGSVQSVLDAYSASRCCIPEAISLLWGCGNVLLSISMLSLREAHDSKGLKPFVETLLSLSSRKVTMEILTTVEHLSSVGGVKGDCFVASQDFVLGSELQMTFQLR